MNMQVSIKVNRNGLLDQSVVKGDVMGGGVMNTGPIFGAADVNIINLFLIKLMKLCLCNISVVIWRMEKG